MKEWLCGVSRGGFRRHMGGWRRFCRFARVDAGMSTAEYAVGTIAAAALATVLYKVVTSTAVSAELQRMIERALHGTV